MSHRPELEAAVEAILFVTTEPVTLERLLEAFDESEREDARVAVEAVRSRYGAEGSRGVRLEEVAGGLRIVTAAECHPYLRRYFDASGANRLSMAALETLAIVAYRQPVTGPEIQELRGKNSSAALRTLLERRMIRITGRREVVGRPFEYATTRDFLMHFGLRDLKDLPPLEEFEEAFGVEVGEREEHAIAHDHEVIGLVSIEEAEAALGSAQYDVREHVDREQGEAAGPVPEARWEAEEETATADAEARRADLPGDPGDSVASSSEGDLVEAAAPERDGDRDEDRGEGSGSA